MTLCLNPLFIGSWFSAHEGYTERTIEGLNPLFIGSWFSAYFIVSSRSRDVS